MLYINLKVDNFQMKENPVLDPINGSNRNNKTNKSTTQKLYEDIQKQIYLQL